MAIINGLKLLNFFYAENGARSKTIIQTIHVVQLFFIYIPIIALCVWVVYKFTRKIKELLVKKTARRASNDPGDQMEAICVDSDDDFLDHRRSLFATESYSLMRRNKSELLQD